MGDGIRKKTLFNLYYKHGEVEEFEMDQTDNARNTLEQAIVNYFATGEHCFLDIPACTIRYTNTAHYRKDKYSNIKNISFVNLMAVIIKDIDHDNYNDRGGTCVLGNGRHGVDYGCMINFSFPNVSDPILHKIHLARFVGAWSHRQNPGDDISELFAAWMTHKQYPTNTQNLKWIVRSECFASTTTLYILNFNIIHSIEASYYYDYDEFSPDKVPEPFPEN